jgi:hypothetical protein
LGDKIKEKDGYLLDSGWIRIAQKVQAKAWKLCMVRLPAAVAKVFLW